MIKISKEQSFYIKGASLLFFILIYWLTLAPSQLGGPLTYVIVNGKSMEPGFILGDLVLVREEPVYSAGDAVVYHDPELQQFVFHRVVGMETDRFILQGDNNGWFDSYRPTQNEIVGKLWLHVPNFGKLINWVRVPVNAAITAGLFGVLLMMDLFKRTPRTKRVGGSPPIHVGATSQLSLAIFSALAVLFLIVGVFAFTRPVDLPAENILYQQTGDYYYSATGTPGVYDTDVVQTGEPVFPKLTCFLNIGFTYTLIGDGIQNVTGTQSMYARIMDKQSGWQRTVPLYPETVFNGASNC
jgi:signal peptidase I